MNNPPRWLCSGGPITHRQLKRTKSFLQETILCERRIAVLHSVPVTLEAANSRRLELRSLLND